MNLTCTELFPANACGPFGDCVVNGSAEIESCSCEDGWTKGLEMALYFLDKSQVESVGICQQNLSIEYVIWVGLLLLKLLLLFKFFLRTPSRSVLRIIWPVFMESVGSLGVIVFRLLNMETFVFGNSLVFNAYISINFFSFILVSWLLYFRYINYVATRLGGDSTVEKRSLFLLVLYDCVSYLLLTVSAVFIGRVGLIMLRVAFTMMVLRGFYTIYFTRRILGILIRDINFLKTKRAELSQSLDMTTSTLAKERTIRKMAQYEKLMKTTLFVRRLIFIIETSWIILHVGMLLLPFGLYAYGYLLPVIDGLFTTLGIFLLPHETKEKRSSFFDLTSSRE